MSADPGRIGILGGSGMLGSAIVTGLMASGTMTGSDIVIANRSGRRDGLGAFPEIAVTTDPEALCRDCDTLLLCLPPAQTAGLRLPAKDRLVVSVMAGVSLQRLGEITGSAHLVRAMSSPAAALRLAYSPWIACDALAEDDKARVTALFSAVGGTDEMPSEPLIDLFTAMTGPVPGFVAFFADAMMRHAIAEGAPEAAALKAVRQLFHASGVMMAQGPSPAAHVQEMIDYAGTTATGLEVMRDGPLRDAVAEALAAATARARSIG